MLAWKQSYKGIFNDDYLKFVNAIVIIKFRLYNKSYSGGLYGKNKIWNDS